MSSNSSSSSSWAERAEVVVMDLRRPTPTVLASQASYSPPAPPSHHHPSSHHNNNNNNNTGQSLAVDYAAAAAAAAVAGEAAASLVSFDGSTGYHGGKIETAGVSVGRQPLQESTGNAQQHPHHHPHHPHQAQNGHHHHQQQHHPHSHHQAHHHQAAASHYPPGQYPLPSLPSTRSCTPALGSLGGPLAPPPAPVPTPPILGSNVPQQVHHVGSAAAAGAVPSSSLRLRRYHLDIIRKRNQNPIYDCPEFAQYRLKQKDKDCKVWPDVLEHAFLDALLLVLSMGRRKFYMGSKQHGRNMIISEYIWLRWLATLPPEKARGIVKANDDLPDEHKDKHHPMFRKRKQVSSHIQVLKGFFKLNWAYHFLFSKGKEEGSKDKKKLPTPNRWYKENTDQRPFKDDPVLRALEQKRLPTVRPNYEYFRQLLAMDSKVQVRPSTCWIYVANSRLRDQPATSPSLPLTSIDHNGKPSSSSSVQGDPDMVIPNPYGVNPNGASTVINTYHAKKGLLFREDFPHRYAFNNPTTSGGSAVAVASGASSDGRSSGESPWAAREQQVRNIRETLLHEYTYPLRQTEASSAREVLDEWESEHPDLHGMLQNIITQHELQNAHELPATHLCDIIHVDVTFDVHRVRCLPEGTSFEWPFKIQVAQPGLQGHDWRVRTWLERPIELSRSKSEAGRGRTVVMTKDEKSMMNEMTHVRGCGDNDPNCDCRSRSRSSTWLVPIPASTWAESLDMCAQFPRYLLPKKRGSSRSKKEDEMPESDTVTQMDLMRNTAMFQELWSSAPVGPGSLEPTWTRRAVILWTFNTVHFFDKENNLCETPAGSAWRFLSAVDPLSQIHQERVLLQGNAQSDRGVVSPSPGFQQILNSHMAENMGSVWSLPAGNAHPAPGSMPVSPMAPYGLSPVHVEGTFSNGLVTPPPSAALPSTYAFEGAPLHSQSLGSHTGYVPVSSIDAKSTAFMGENFHTDPYLQGTGHTSFYEEADDNESDTTLQGETADLSGFGAQQWSSMNSSAHAANQSVSLDPWDHHGLHSLSVVAEEMAGNSGEHRTDSFEEDVHLQQSYDPYAQLRAEARERRTQSPGSYLRHDEQQRLRESYERRVRQEVSNHGHGHSEAWHATTSPATGGQAGSIQGYGQGSSAHLSQSTVDWSDELSQIHPSQPHRGEGLPMVETRALQDYGSASLSPLLNRKRRRDDDEGVDANRCSLGSLPSYAHRDDGRYVPTPLMDRQDDHGWS